MSFELVPLKREHLSAFKNDMREAFEALADGDMVGGAVVTVDKNARRGRLDLLYVKNGIHGRGVGRAVWSAVEARFPYITLWETVTPYFEKRNIHFYVNKCGFHIVEFYNKYNPDPNDPDGVDEGDAPENEFFDGMFRFEKRL